MFSRLRRSQDEVIDRFSKAKTSLSESKKGGGGEINFVIRTKGKKTRDQEHPESHDAPSHARGNKPGGVKS